MFKSWVEKFFSLKLANKNKDKNNRSIKKRNILALFWLKKIISNGTNIKKYIYMKGLKFSRMSI